MSKAEDYIRKNTRDGSNKFGGGQHDDEYVSPYYYWLTPNQARRAVEIAREEIYEWLDSHSEKYVYWMDEEFGKEDLINDLKQAMKNG